LDIEGSQIGSKNRINKYHSQNFNLSNQDIDNSNASSLKRGIITKRNINPLDPDYQFPGKTEGKLENNPYGDTLHKKKPKEVLKIVDPKNIEINTNER